MGNWIAIGIAYALIMVVGVRLGLYLASRFWPRGGGPVSDPTPSPDGPSFGAEWGTDFDRQWLPDVDFDRTSAHV